MRIIVPRYAVLLTVLPGTLAGCAGASLEGEPVTREVRVSVAQAVRAADAVFGQQGIPVQESDEAGGHLRSGIFDPRSRWGALTDGRITCGADETGLDRVHAARTVEVELRMEVRRIRGARGAGAEPRGTEVSIWGSGWANVDGSEHPCGVRADYREELVQAIVERAERRSAVF